jgi:hypothetical protein
VKAGEGSLVEATLSEPALHFSDEIVRERVTVFFCDRHKATIGSTLHPLYESFALRGDRRNHHLRGVQQRSHVVRKSPRETFHFPDFIDNDQLRRQVSEIDLS